MKTENFILVRDIDNGITVARLESEIKTSDNSIVKLYRHEEYYHSLDDALKDMYGIQKEEKK